VGTGREPAHDDSDELTSPPGAAPAAAAELPGAVAAARAAAGCGGAQRCFLRSVGRPGYRRGGPRLAPALRQRLLIHHRHEHRRTDRDPTPLRDPVIELARGIACLLLRRQVLDRLGQLLDLLAQPQRGGQQHVGGHALPAQVVPQPGLALVGLAPPGERLAGTWQVIERAALPPRSAGRSRTRSSSLRACAPSFAATASHLRRSGSGCYAVQSRCQVHESIPLTGRGGTREQGVGR